jgi:hypothetical protein
MRPTGSGVVSNSHVPVASVRSSWADWHVAHVPVIQICDLHWDEMPGHRTTEVVLCGFTSCDAVIAGELPHADDARHPHNVRVCILPEDNDRGVFHRLAWEAGPKPRRTHPVAA